MGIQILDAVTLKRLKSFARQEGSAQLFTISTGSRLLTWLGRNSGKFISWDLQTGVPVSEIHGEGRSARDARSIVYSGRGTMFGVLFKGRDAASIGIYNVSSGTPIHFHSVEESVIDTVWAHDECVRYATLGPGTITIWEVGFASTRPPTEVEFLSTPSNFDSSQEFLFLPTLSRLAPVLGRSVIVWDTQHSKFLLDSADVGDPRKMSFSADGRFFAYGTDGLKIYLWEDSPTGYTPHRTLVSGAVARSEPCEPLLSPNGQSIVVSDGSILQLWRTMDSTAPSSSTPTQSSQCTERFIMGFSPNESLAAAARLVDNTVVVLDLRSGVSRLVIDAGMRVHGLRVAENTVVVVGDGKIITWGLPAENGVVNLKVNVENSIRETAFGNSAPNELRPGSLAIVSPNLDYIAVAATDVGLRIYDMSTGKYLAGTESGGDMPWFTPDGHEVWCRSTVSKGEGWAIDRHRGSDVTKLQDLNPSGSPPGGFPWRSPHASKVTDDGWILSSSGK